jgi:hypothetical protein
MVIDIPVGLDIESPPGKTSLKIKSSSMSKMWLNKEVEQTINRISIVPRGGCGNLSPYLFLASLNTLISCTDPGHPVTTKVNLKSKS